MSIFSVLGLIFIVLKIIGTISWSWWLVLLPFYGVGFIIIFLLFFPFLVFGASRKSKK